jgi:hypothetical protein
LCHEPKRRARSLKGSGGNSDARPLALERAHLASVDTAPVPRLQAPGRLEGAPGPVAGETGRRRPCVPVDVPDMGPELPPG